MDIASLSMAMGTSNVNSDVGIAVLGKNLDTLKQAGDGMLKMMESSVTPNLGQNIDYSA
ncbi:YjfB family protein [[Clostridium] fimetarium]|uniref:Putative motility protein n=1 Tax=[Clostridium] fimetarium TaxID=99656 RepID=A0A1I0M3H5_9FIRM|nr:YjfB family protein [[Clostridium] fimetarium]SEV82903.1 Putative motility protein [[Clostridium] fimetarium]